MNSRVYRVKGYYGDRRSRELVMERFFETERDAVSWAFSEAMEHVDGDESLIDPVYSSSIKGDVGYPVEFRATPMVEAISLDEELTEGTKLTLKIGAVQVEGSSETATET